MGDIDYYYPMVMGDGDGQGGLRSVNAIPRSSLENVFPHVPGTELTSGVTRYRKIHAMNISGTISSLKLFLDRLTNAEDYMQIAAGGYADAAATGDEIGWTDTVTWTLGSRQCVTSGAQAELVPGMLVLFNVTATGAFRGLATVATWTNTTTWTISSMIRGSNPVTGDTARVFWIGSGDLNTALTGGVDDEVIADFEVASGIYVGMYVALVDWDNLDANGKRTVEFCLIDDIAWAGTEATITLSAVCGANHAVKTQGTQTGTGDENFDLDGLTLLVSVNGDTYQTVTFESDGMTAAEVATFINDETTGCTASASGTNVKIVTDDYYEENSIQLGAASTALTELGLDSDAHYGTTGTVVAGVLELGSLAASHSTPSKSSALGTFTNSITDYDLGAIYDTIVVTFTSATAFTVTGTNVSSYTGSTTIGSGTTDAEFKVAHNGSYLFAIPVACWGGTWASGDTVTFVTYPAAKGVWIKEVVGAGAAADSLNRAHLSSYASW